LGIFWLVLPRLGLDDALFEKGLGEKFALHVYFGLNNVRDSGVLVQGTLCTPEREKLN
jgi:hypothetical protein